jgi:hypothetical protein
VVKWSILLLSIRVVPGSNLGPKTDYPDYSFYQFLLENVGIIPQIK